jgi:4'-phosphopantetheinyl transferase
MPLILIKELSEDLILGLWHITESTKALLSLLPTNSNLSDFETLTIEKQQLEWLSSRLLCAVLLQNLGFTASNIQKDIYGKPFLVDIAFQISIAHSFPYATVALHQTKAIGIDIEAHSNKIAGIAHRVFHAEELAWATLEDYTLLWCAKEAMYKCYGKRSIDFREHLRVHKHKTGYVGKFLFEKLEVAQNMLLFEENIDNFKIVVCVAG